MRILQCTTRIPQCTTRNLSFYHKDTPGIPKETMRYPREYPMTIDTFSKEGILGALYHVCSKYHKESFEYFEMSTY
jgi:hypothetical protein